MTHRKSIPIDVQPTDAFEVYPGLTLSSEVDDAYRMQLYLSKLPEELGVTLSDRVRWLWGCLSLKYKKLPIPICGRHGVAAFQFAWNNERMYLDLEIELDATLSWTWFDRDTNEMDGEEFKKNFTEFSPAFFKHLEEFGAKEYGVLDLMIGASLLR